MSSPSPSTSSSSPSASTTTAMSNVSFRPLTEFFRQKLLDATTKADHARLVAGKMSLAWMKAGFQLAQMEQQFVADPHAYPISWQKALDNYFSAPADDDDDGDDDGMLDGHTVVMSTRNYFWSQHPELGKQRHHDSDDEGGDGTQQQQQLDEASLAAEERRRFRQTDQLVTFVHSFDSRLTEAESVRELYKLSPKIAVVICLPLSRCDVYKLIFYNEETKVRFVDDLERGKISINERLLRRFRSHTSNYIKQLEKDVMPYKLMVQNIFLERRTDALKGLQEAFPGASISLAGKSAIVTFRSRAETVKAFWRAKDLKICQRPVLVTRKRRH